MFPGFGVFVSGGCTSIIAWVVGILLCATWLVPSVPRHQYSECAQTPSAPRHQCSECAQAPSAPRHQCSECAQASSVPRHQCSGFSAQSVSMHQVRQGTSDQCVLRHQCLEFVHAPSAPRHQCSECVQAPVLRVCPCTNYAQVPVLRGCVQTWCPSTVPKNDSWWALMWTHHFFKYPCQNCPCWVQGQDLVLGHWTGQWYIGYPVSEHSTILCRCPGTSGQALSANTALDPDYLLLLLLSDFFFHNTVRTYMYMEYFISDSSSQKHTNLQSTCVFSESFSSFAFVNDNLGTNMQWK